MTVIVTVAMAAVNTEEHFFSFLHVESTTGKNLSDALKEELDVHDIYFAHCKGQGCNNGSSISGNEAVYKQGN